MSYYLWFIIIFIILWLLRKYIFNAPRNSKTKNLNNKVVILTGSSAGIGKETAKDLLKSGATVIFACRDERKTKAVISDFPTYMQDRAIFIMLDLCRISTIYKFVEEFKKQFNTVDILINNAGCLSNTFQLTEDKIENTMQANHIGHMVLTTLLLENFNQSEGRIINLASGAAELFSDFNLEKIKELQNNLDYNNI